MTTTSLALLQSLATLLLILLTVAISAAAFGVFRWANAHAALTKSDQGWHIVVTGVLWAEQALAHMDPTARKSPVLDFVMEVAPWMSRTLASGMIEAAVKGLHDGAAAALLTGAAVPQTAQTPSSAAVGAASIITTAAPITWGRRAGDPPPPASASTSFNSTP